MHMHQLTLWEAPVGAENALSVPIAAHFLVINGAYQVHERILSAFRHACAILTAGIPINLSLQAWLGQAFSCCSYRSLAESRKSPHLQHPHHSPPTRIVQDLQQHTIQLQQNPLFRRAVSIYILHFLIDILYCTHSDAKSLLLSVSVSTVPANLRLESRFVAYPPIQTDFNQQGCIMTSTLPAAF
jgi:hypothetical protein